MLTVWLIIATIIILIGGFSLIFLYFKGINKKNAAFLETFTTTLSEDLQHKYEAIHTVVQNNVNQVQLSLNSSLNILPEKFTVIDEIVLLLKELQPEEGPEEGPEDPQEFWNAIIGNALTAYLNMEETQAYLQSLLQTVNPVAAEMAAVDPEKVKEGGARFIIDAMSQRSPLLFENARRVLGEDWQKQIEENPATFARIMEYVSNILPGFMGNGNHGATSPIVHKSKSAWD